MFPSVIQMSDTDLAVTLYRSLYRKRATVSKLRTFALRSLPNTIDVFPTAVERASSKVRKLLCADWLPQNSGAV